MSDNIQQPAGADLEAARVRSILDLGDQYSKYLGARDAADAVRNGKSVEQFRDLIMSKMETRHTDTSAAHVGMTKTEARRYSLGRALRAAVLGDWSDAGLEREASEAVAKIMGRAPEGFYVPLDIYRRDFNVGTSTEAGNLVATDDALSGARSTNALAAGSYVTLPHSRGASWRASSCGCALA